MAVKHLLIESSNQLLCKTCYDKETKFLFEIFQDILDNSYSCFGYTTDQINHFKTFNLEKLKILIYHHFTVVKDHYIGNFTDEILQIIKSQNCK